MVSQATEKKYHLAVKSLVDSNLDPSLLLKESDIRTILTGTDEA